MAGGIDHAVGAAADQVAEDGEKLEENGGGVGLGVRGDGADGESRETVEGGFAQLRSHRWPGAGVSGASSGGAGFSAGGSGRSVGCSGCGGRLCSSARAVAGRRG